jgi:uncharacterized protein (DUF1499 family)
VTALADSFPPSPLEACPGTPNCVRDARSFNQDPRTLWLMAEHALSELGTQSVRADEPSLSIEATFKAFVFTDDVVVRVVEWGDGAVLYVRSASRVGRHDLGVNGRRVARFWKHLDAQIAKGREKGWDEVR